MYFQTHGGTSVNAKGEAPGFWRRRLRCSSTFLRAGVPAVDLIDWRYPGHSLADGLDKISRQSLDAVGETVVQLVSELREERPSALGVPQPAGFGRGRMEPLVAGRVMFTR